MQYVTLDDKSRDRQILISYYTKKTADYWSSVTFSQHKAPLCYISKCYQNINHKHFNPTKNTENYLKMCNMLRRAICYSTKSWGRAPFDIHSRWSHFSNARKTYGIKRAATRHWQNIASKWKIPIWLWITVPVQYVTIRTITWQLVEIDWN